MITILSYSTVEEVYIGHCHGFIQA
jgi:hypothetical protein